MTETYLPIEGFAGLYEVSNKGNIKALERVREFQTYPEKILKIEKTRKGYCRVMLSKNNKKSKIYIHRMVANAFVPNPKNKIQINHKNLDKADNRAENLEWVTGSENCFHWWKTRETV